MFFASPGGPTVGTMDFYHATSDCSDSRHLQIMGGVGFAYFASVRGGMAFYTKTLDPTGTLQIPIMAYEHFEPGEDATQPGVCLPIAGGAASLGVVTMTTDPVLTNLALPLRFK